MEILYTEVADGTRQTPFAEDHPAASSPNATTASGDDVQLYDYDGSVWYVVIVLMVFSFSILAFMASMIRKTQREEESVDDYLKNKASLYQEMRILQTNRTQNVLLKRKMQRMLREKMSLDYSSLSLTADGSEYSTDVRDATSETRDPSDTDLVQSSTSDAGQSRASQADRLPPPLISVTNSDGRTQVKYHSFTDVTLL